MRNKMNIKKLFLVGMLLSAGLSMFEYVDACDHIFTVDGAGGGQYTKIQDAINDASEGDTIIVYPYTYDENLTIEQNCLVLKSTNGPEETVIFSDGRTSAVFIGSDEGGYGRRGDKDKDGNEVLIEGFTITNGSNDAGGGIYIEAYSNSTIKNNIIMNNRALKWGGGIFVDHTSVVELSDNEILDNVAEDGAGIACWQSSPNIHDNIIEGNMAINRGGGILSYEIYSEPQIINNIIFPYKKKQDLSFEILSRVS